MRELSKKARRRLLIRRLKVVSSVVSIIVIIGCLLLEHVVEAQAVQLEEPEIIIEETLEQEEAQEQETVVFYPVPLDYELQFYIVQLCEEHHIPPEIVFGMIQRESNFDASAIGDNGKAFGLMQIQPKWHSERMKSLCVDDLLNPYQNVTVGVDYLVELLEKGNGLEWALAAYNAGPSGVSSGLGWDYVEAVIRNSENIQEGAIERVLQ